MSNDYPKRKSHRLDREIYSSSGYEFSFTLCARHHGKPFHDPGPAEEIVQSLLWTRKHYQWLLYCYCLMPDHLHFVCRLLGKEAVSMNGGVHGEVGVGVLEHVARFKSFTTTISWRRGFNGTLWQKSSYDRVLDLERPFVEVVEYVLHNPVRKGLVKQWEQWPYARVVDKW